MTEQVENGLTRWERRKARTRTALLEALQALLLERGYDALTVQDITDRADYARATFYVHFDDKADATWQLISTAMMPIVHKIKLMYAQSTYAQGKYRVLVELFAFSRENADLLRIMLGDKGHPQLSQRLQDFIASTIEEGMAEGSFSTNFPTGVNVPDNFAAQFMTGALVRIMMWSIFDGSTYDTRELARMFFESLMRMPLPPEMRDE